MDEPVFEVDQRGELGPVVFVVWDSGTTQRGGRSTFGGDDDGCGLERIQVVVICLVDFGGYSVEDAESNSLIIRDL